MVFAEVSAEWWLDATLVQILETSMNLGRENFLIMAWYSGWVLAAFTTRHKSFEQARTILSSTPVCWIIKGDQGWGLFRIFFAMNMALAAIYEGLHL